MATLKIGERIKAKRRARDLTQEELASMLGVSKAAVSKWENEESYPDITMLPQIAKLFHIKMDELFDYTLEYKPLVIVNEYHFGLSLDNVDKRVLDHGTVKSCNVYKTERLVGEHIESTWETRIEFISTSVDKSDPDVLSCLCAMEVVNSWKKLGKLGICYKRCEKM